MRSHLRLVIKSGTVALSVMRHCAGARTAIQEEMQNPAGLRPLQRLSLPCSESALVAIIMNWVLKP